MQMVGICSKTNCEWGIAQMAVTQQMTSGTSADSKIGNMAQTVAPKVDQITNDVQYDRITKCYWNE